MTDRKFLEQIVNEYITDKDIFLVSIRVSRDNDIEIAIECTSRDVEMDDCANLSRFVESKLDRETEDFSLTVTSAGLTSPFKVFKQYEKFVGKEIEVMQGSGTKLHGILRSATPEVIELEYETLEAVEGKKRKAKVLRTDAIPMSSIKSAKPVIRFE